MALPFEYNRKSVRDQLLGTWESANGVVLSPAGGEAFGTLQVVRLAVRDVRAEVPLAALWKIKCCLEEGWKYESWSHEMASNIADNFYRSDLQGWSLYPVERDPFDEYLIEEAGSVLAAQLKMPSPANPPQYLRGRDPGLVPSPLHGFGSGRAILADRWNNKEALFKTDTEWRLVHWYTLA